MSATTIGGNNLRVIRSFDHSVISGSNVHSDKVIKTTSKNSSSTIQNCAMAMFGSASRSALVPRTPAIMTGIVTGYNRSGGSTSRLHARASMAAKSVPTHANLSVHDNNNA